jgi:Zn-dependent membrane protease YugP
MGLLVIGIIFAIISAIVSSRLKNKFRRYSRTPLHSNLSGREIAEHMLRDNGIYDVRVISVQGQLTDHYNPVNKTVNLSEPVFAGRNAAAAAVAAHECGHAVQHATAYSMLKLRTALVPIQNASAKILNMIMLFSIFGGAFLFRTFPTDLILMTIIGTYSILTLFSFITLPVEIDASKRALKWISSRGIVDQNEYGMAKDALKWAALTYVVAALGSLASLLYFLAIFLGRRD